MHEDIEKPIYKEHIRTVTKPPPIVIVEEIKETVKEEVVEK